MIAIQISPQDMDQLNQERYPHPHPRVQRKLHALDLVGLSYSRHDVARMIGVAEGTLRHSIHAYERGGLEALQQFHPQPKTAALDRHATPLRAAFEAHPSLTPCKRPSTGSHP